MHHARKMVLVPEETLSRFRNSSSSNAFADPLATESSTLDFEMQRILARKDLHPHDKWKLYQQSLHRYLQLADQSRQPLKLEIESKLPLQTGMEVAAAESTEMPNNDLQHVQQQLSIDDIVQFMPQNRQQKAKVLLNSLKTNGLSWNANGEVFVDNGQKLNRSNITDLMYDLMTRSNRNPTGWQEFATFISQSNLPQSVILNPKRLQFLQRLGNGAKQQQQHMMPGTSSSSSSSIGKMAKSIKDMEIPILQKFKQQRKSSRIVTKRLQPKLSSSSSSSPRRPKAITKWQSFPAGV